MEIICFLKYLFRLSFFINIQPIIYAQIINIDICLNWLYNQYISYVEYNNNRLKLF